MVKITSVSPQHAHEVLSPTPGSPANSETTSIIPLSLKLINIGADMLLTVHTYQNGCQANNLIPGYNSFRGINCAIANVSVMLTFAGLSSAFYSVIQGAGNILTGIAKKRHNSAKLAQGNRNVGGERYGYITNLTEWIDVLRSEGFELELNIDESQSSTNAAQHYVIDSSIVAVLNDPAQSLFKDAKKVKYGLCVLEDNN
ncbi:hypothetical protein WICPIJ_001815 [Wickerhamomyces pijperi]|uniref:Uncharacterized protein n=1 Tax=Wickerhamomyces pijperi TaxID=599730 RepID=A0A9P8QCW4_WICPI|nr:hypothetical protein WICPIJ_001815 [Wickerhamomyces pijperi]